MAGEPKVVGAQEASRALEGGGTVELVGLQQMGATFDVQAMRWENLRMATSWVGWRLTEVVLSLNILFTFLREKNLYMIIVVFFYYTLPHLAWISLQKIVLAQND